jgi:hypothetical protein
VSSGEATGAVDHDHDLYGWERESGADPVRGHRRVAGHRRPR